MMSCVQNCPETPSVARSNVFHTIQYPTVRKNFCRELIDNKFTTKEDICRKEVVNRTTVIKL